jgi:2-polyprenyl-3-methyl-5-hydroxy-6-metoxy-1,4-benzoquinol methylase
MDLKQQIQEQKYYKPYHFLPVVDGNDFSQCQYWSWGFRYLGRLQIVFECLEKISFSSLLDIGCGDGRFLAEMEERFPGKRYCGIDISSTAINWARRMAPDVSFTVGDITSGKFDERFDVVTLLDVIEHIPQAELGPFIHAVSATLRPGGCMVLTVPHTNMRPDSRHYQHFNQQTLDSLLDGEFIDRQFIHFDRISLALQILLKLMGGQGHYYVITSQTLNNFLYNTYRKHCLHASSADGCQRLACIARKAGDQTAGSSL